MLVFFLLECRQAIRAQLGVLDILLIDLLQLCLFLRAARRCASPRGSIITQDAVGTSTSFLLTWAELLPGSCFDLCVVSRLDLGLLALLVSLLPNQEQYGCNGKNTHGATDGTTNRSAATATAVVAATRVGVEGTVMLCTGDTA